LIVEFSGAEVPLTVVEPQPPGVHMCHAKPPDRLQSINTLHSRQVAKKLFNSQLIGLRFEAAKKHRLLVNGGGVTSERCEGEHLIILKLSGRWKIVDLS